MTSRWITALVTMVKEYTLQYNEIRFREVGVANVLDRQKELHPCRKITVTQEPRS